YEPSSYPKPDSNLCVYLPWLLSHIGSFRSTLQSRA
ncbi:hypothetical protein Tco_0193230, partial [Tanacetum coccineum]